MDFLKEEILNYAKQFTSNENNTRNSTINLITVCIMCKQQHIEKQQQCGKKGTRQTPHTMCKHNKV